MEGSVDLVDLLTIRTIVHLGAEEIGSLGKLLVEGRRERGEGWEEREVRRKERETSTSHTHTHNLYNCAH